MSLSVCVDLRREVRERSLEGCSAAAATPFRKSSPQQSQFRFPANGILHCYLPRIIPGSILGRRTQVPRRRALSRWQPKGIASSLVMMDNGGASIKITNEQYLDDGRTTQGRISKNQHTIYNKQNLNTHLTRFLLSKEVDKNQFF